MFTIVGIVGDIREEQAPPAETDVLCGVPAAAGRLVQFHAGPPDDCPPSSLVADARRVIQELSPEVAPQFRAIDEVGERPLQAADLRWA